MYTLRQGKSMLLPRAVEEVHLEGHFCYSFHPKINLAHTNIPPNMSACRKDFWLGGLKWGSSRVQEDYSIALWGSRGGFQESLKVRKTQDAERKGMPEIESDSATVKFGNEKEKRIFYFWVLQRNIISQIPPSGPLYDRLSRQLYEW